MTQCPPKYVPALGACKRIISYFKGGKHLNVNLATVCYAGEKLEFIKQSPNDFY